MKIRKALPLLIAFGPAIISSILPGLPAQDSPIQILSIAFEGNAHMSDLQLKRLFSNSREGSLYISQSLQADLQQVQLAYLDSGFLKVKLAPPDVRIQTVGSRKIAAIRIAISEGPLYSTGEMTVKNAEMLVPDTIMQLCPLKKDQPYSRQKIVQWQSKIEEAYRTLGYLRARCLLNEAVNDDRKIVNAVMDCIEGKMYRVGKITINGDGSVNPMQFKRRLLFSEGGVFNPDMVATTIYYVNQSHLYEPISGSDLQVTINDGNATVDITITVVARKEQP
jgi:outer membrane protein insertion porin family